MTSKISENLALVSTDYSGRGGGFLMEFASYPKLTARNVLPTPKSAQPVSENQTATLTWQANLETPSDIFLQGSLGGTSFPGPRHPPVETYTGVTDSSCALSLLSSQTWGPRNMAPNVELNNLLNFNGTPMTTQLAASSHVAAVHQLPNASWYFKGIDSGNCPHEVVADIGLGQNSQPFHHTHLPGELDVSQQGRRHYMDLGQSRAYESPHWSL